MASFSRALVRPRGTLSRVRTQRAITPSPRRVEKRPSRPNWKLRSPARVVERPRAVVVRVQYEFWRGDENEAGEINHEISGNGGSQGSSEVIVMRSRRECPNSGVGKSNNFNRLQIGHSASATSPVSVGAAYPLEASRRPGRAERCSPTRLRARRDLLPLVFCR
jgi:hypothetical protein